ncbi:MAG: hypothetical protein ABJ239_01525 [Erythrobacter sp.]
MIRIPAIIVAALMLQGCLAAAIPVVAGSVLASRDVIQEGQENSGDLALAPSVTPNSGPEIAGDADASRAPQANVVPKATQSPASLAAISNFASYTARQASLGQGEAQSALLKNPGALDGVRANCGDTPSAVLIDLDPDGGILPIDNEMVSNQALSSALDRLRSQGVTIGWISGRLTIDAESVREKLIAGGLDPLGQDTLLLMQSFDQNKQQRRREFGRDYCVLAISGDTLSDFDELFVYLKNQDSALRLNPLRDAGWFITPLPLNPSQAPTGPRNSK